MSKKILAKTKMRIYTDKIINIIEKPRQDEKGRYICGACELNKKCPHIETKKLFLKKFNFEMKSCESCGDFKQKCHQWRSNRKGD